MHYTSSFWCELRELLAVGWLQFVGPQLATSQQLQVHATDTKTASVVPPEDGTLDARNM
jgi:hypothetical protein